MGFGGYYALQSKQEREDIKGTLNSVRNAMRAVPCVSICVADYLYHLRGLDYKSDEYKEVRSKCHERAAKRFLKVCEKN